MLVIGCGAGVTAGAVSIDPAVERETIAEIEPLVPQGRLHILRASTTSTSSQSEGARADRRRAALPDDDQARSSTPITSDPLDPWVKGAAMLYTREFFEMVKQHLNPGGVVTLFVQLYESNTEAVKSEIATFFEVFPNGVVWGNTNKGEGYDLVLLGQVRADEDRRRRGPAQAAAAGVRADGAVAARDRHELRRRSVLDLRRPQPDLAPWLTDATINRDRNLRLQYLAGMGLNLYQGDVIYSDMLVYARHFPDELFVASPTTMQALREAIQRAQGQ